jgi:hypothetical protein
MCELAGCCGASASSPFPPYTVVQCLLSSKTTPSLTFVSLFASCLHGNKLTTEKTYNGHKLSTEDEFVTTHKLPAQAHQRIMSLLQANIDRHNAS